MLTSNPKIDGSTTSVTTLLNNLPKTNPTAYSIKGTIALPDWFGFAYHLQGVAPYNGTAGNSIMNGCITGSSTVGYFLDFTENGTDQPTVSAVTKPDANYYHAAGIQMLGDILPVPLESDKSGYGAKVAFYNVGSLSNPTAMYTLAMPVQPAGSKAAKASATAITTYTDANSVEQALLAVYQYDPRYMYFFKAPVSSLANTANPWVLLATYTGSALEGDQFQSFAMVTQAAAGTPDQIYLMGFREDEELHLYTVSLSASSVNLTAVKTYTGWKGSDWRNGVGLQIYNPTTLRIFGTDKDPSGSSTNYTIKVFVWK